MARRTSHDWRGCQELADCLQWYLHHSLRQETEYAILVVRPVILGANSVAESAVPAASLQAIAEHLGAQIRRTDHLKTLDGYCIGIVLHGACSAGARAAFRRLHRTLQLVAEENDLSCTLALGYAVGTTDTADTADDHVTIPQIVRAAWRPRAFVALGATPEIGSVTASSAAMSQEETLPQVVAIAEAAEEPQRRKAATAAVASILAARGTVAPALAAAHQAHEAHRAHLHLVAEKEIAALPDGHETLRARAHALGVPFALLPRSLPLDCRDALEPEIAHELRAVVIGRSRMMLTVALEDPCDAAVLRLRAVTGMNVFPVLAASEEIGRALRQIGSRRASS